jgi:dolichyl-phosphate-mannose--protein O-mannosyl transferase
MPSVEKNTKGAPSCFLAGVLGLWFVSLGLRFWGLERFNTLVFDEVYYVKFAHNYLTHTPFFDGHPPLSKYLIAIAIGIGNHLPIGLDAVNTKAGAAYTTWSYRWLNALTGSLIPLVVTAIAYYLTRRYSYALLAGVLMGMDGLFLVESRYALNNVYLDILGLIGLLLLLLALDGLTFLERGLWLTLSGIFFGASAAIKWNGLWFLLAAYGLWGSAWIIRWFSRRRDAANDPATLPDAGISPLSRLTRLRWWQMGLYLGAVPVVCYWLIWIPHLRINPQETFWGLQRQMLDYHQHVGDGPQIHPYCSKWYSWVLMLRPVAYFYQVTNPGDPLPTGNSKLTAGPDRLIYDVHAIGNPFLWWLSTIAMGVAIVALVIYAIHWIRQLTNRAGEVAPVPLALNPTELWLLLFLVIGYLANLLPWIRVSRCAFLYHYMGASLFATMALAWLVDRWLHSRQPHRRTAGIAVITLITLAFIFWMPIYLGLPLSPIAFQIRMWLPSWL